MRCASSTTADSLFRLLTVGHGIDAHVYARGEVREPDVDVHSNAQRVERKHDAVERVRSVTRAALDRFDSATEVVMSCCRQQQNRTRNTLLCAFDSKLFATGEGP